MTPNSFEFVVTLRADVRFLAAVRQLASQSADYAQLPADTSTELATEVERATGAAIGQAAGGPIEIVFSGSDTAVSVTISCTSSAETPHATSSATEGISVEWTSINGRRICHIRQRIPA
jgi:hypothetical protein